MHATARAISPSPIATEAIERSELATPKPLQMPKLANEFICEFIVSQKRADMLRDPELEIKSALKWVGMKAYPIEGAIKGYAELMEQAKSHNTNLNEVFKLLHRVIDSPWDKERLAFASGLLRAVQKNQLDLFES